MPVQITVSNNDIDALARLAYQEASSVSTYLQSVAGGSYSAAAADRLAYGAIVDTILNRVSVQNATRYGLSIQAVIDHRSSGIPDYSPITDKSSNGSWTGLPNAPTNVYTAVENYIKERTNPVYDHGAEVLPIQPWATHYINPSRSSALGGWNLWGKNLITPNFIGENPLDTNGVPKTSVVEGHVFGLDGINADGTPAPRPQAFTITYDANGNGVIDPGEEHTFTAPPYPFQKPDVPGVTDQEASAIAPEGGDTDALDTDTRADEINNQIGQAIASSSPLVLDIDGDGIELSSVTSTDSVYWDIDVDGFAEATGWVKGGDGLLAVDLNGDGIINDSAELFGDQTGQSNGFLALKVHDTNADGVINSEDAIFDDLRVWIDTNIDGYSKNTELHSLSDLQISSISLGYTDVNLTNNGNVIKQQSTFVINGSTRTVADAYFTYSNLNTLYNDKVVIDFRVKDLADLRGYGNIPTLHIAMSKDSSGTGNLLGLVKALDSKSFAQVFDDTVDYMNDVKAIMLRWAGVDGVSPTSRGAYIDARELAFLEKFMGQDFLQRGWMTNPGVLAAEDLKEAFTIALNNVAAQLMVQGAGGALFNGTWHYDVSTDSVVGVTGINATALASLSTLSASQSNLELFWQNVIRMVEFTVGVSSLSTADQNALESAINGSNPSLHLTDIVNSLDYESPTGVTLNGTSGANTLTGGTGNDTIDGKEGNDTLNGGIGNDVIHGGTGNDTITGGTGGDYLLGGAGNDTYKYNLGDGWDTILESGNAAGDTADKILFGTGISLSHLTFTRAGNYDLVIDINTGSQTGKIIIEDQFNSSGMVETLSFNGASTYTLTSQVYTMYGSAADDVLVGVTSGGSINDIIYGLDGNDRITADTGADIVYGGAGNDYIVGGVGSDILHGDDGDDTIYGEADNDTIYGGAGNDILYGGDGNDTYHYVSGKDRISDSTGTDILKLDAVWNGATPQYLRLGFDLRIFFSANDYIDVVNHYNGAAVETLQYANSTTVNLTTVSYVAQGTSGNDTMYGTAADNVMYGFAGNDTMYGADGHDTMYGGDGNDIMDGQVGNDVLYGEAGNDTLYGSAGNDYLDGGSGDDYMQGGADNDTYMYISGIDKIYEASGTDTINIVAGYDLEDATLVRRVSGPTDIYDLRIEFSSTNYVWIDGYFYGGGYAVENLVFADMTTVALNSLAYTAYGSSGNDTINGVSGVGLTNDIIYGYAGNDSISALDGTDTVYGGDGADTIYGGNGNDIIYGENGNDYIRGENDNDILRGGAGNDTLYGDAGEDIFIYDSGLDTIYDEGNLGVSDTLKIANTATVDTITFANLSTYDTKITIAAGVDEITVKNLRFGGNYYVVEYVEFADGFKTTLPNYASWMKGTSANNTLTGTTGADTILGLAGTDTINGGAGNDSLHGGAGNDTVNGGDGDDLVHGGVGNDILNGNNNNDILFGGDGLDQLYGGSGADTFMFTADSAFNNIDVVNDFSLAQSDKINIHDLLIGYDPLTKAITDFVQITTSGTDSILKVDADGGANNFVQIATLKNITGLTDEAALVTSGNLIV